jgi:hypothetical protein
MIEVVKLAIIRKRTERGLDSNSHAHGLRWTRRRNASVFYALANIVTDAGCRDRGGSADGGNAPACGTPYDPLELIEVLDTRIVWRRPRHHNSASLRTGSSPGIWPQCRSLATLRGCDAETGTPRCVASASELPNLEHNPRTRLAGRFGGCTHRQGYRGYAGFVRNP